MKPVFVILLLSAGCSRPWMVDESRRIDDGMRPEVFTDQTPGAQGIALGPEAPPLAPMQVEALPRYGYPRGLGWGSRGFGGGGHRFGGQRYGGGSPRSYFAR